MNLIEGIQEKCNFIRSTILPEYEKLGTVGVFGATCLREDIRKGEQAIAGGDVEEMLLVYRQLVETCDSAL
jgi:hypothetical protein